jgi:hypothetical protein
MLREDVMHPADRELGHPIAAVSARVSHQAGIRTIKRGLSMPILQKSIQLAGKPLPKVISPRAHTLSHYGRAALFGIAAALFWRRNRRAAVASLVCGAAETGVAVISSRRGLRPAISPSLHQRIDFGISTMAASMPRFLAFEDERERRLFLMQSALIAGIAVLTEFKPAEVLAQRRKAA